MSERKIKLEDIWGKYKEFTKGPNLPGMVDLDYFKPIVNIMICEGISQALKLAVDNVHIEKSALLWSTDGTLYPKSVRINTQSILDTIKQIE